MNGKLNARRFVETAVRRGVEVRRFRTRHDAATTRVSQQCPLRTSVEISDRCCAPRSDHGRPQPGFRETDRRGRESNDRERTPLELIPRLACDR